MTTERIDLVTGQTAANDMASVEAELLAGMGRQEPRPAAASTQQAERHAREALAYLDSAMDSITDLFTDAQLNALAGEGGMIGLEALRKSFADAAVTLRLAKAEIEGIVHPAATP